MNKKIIKPTTQATIDHNQHFFQRWGIQSCEQNARALLSISVDPEGRTWLQAVDNADHNTLIHMMQLAIGHLQAGNNLQKLN